MPPVFVFAKVWRRFAVALALSIAIGFLHRTAGRRATLTNMSRTTSALCLWLLLKGVNVARWQEQRTSR
jgi:hypothetical protein